MTKLDTAHRKAVATGTFAFTRQRKEPLENAAHVRNAIARFDQVKDVTDAERDTAWKHIRTAAKKFGVEMAEGSWKEVGKKH